MEVLAVGAGRDETDLSDEEKKFAAWWFRNFEPARFKAEPGYGLEHAIHTYRKWAETEADRAAGLRTLESDVTFGLTGLEISAELDRFKTTLDNCRQWASELQSRLGRQDDANEAARPNSPVSVAGPLTNLDRYNDVFAGITPWSGEAPAGMSVDFLGIRTRQEYLPLLDFGPGADQPRQVVSRLPQIEDGEFWFEPVDWFETAREARGRYTMITLGANYGAQAVGAAMALKAINPMPFKLVAVEPVPQNLRWTAQHMRDNDIDPNDHWLFETSIGGDNAPVLFPVGSPGSGAQNSYSTNEVAARRHYVNELTRTGRVEEALRSLLLENRTGITTNLVPGYDLPAEIQLVSGIALSDILAAFDYVDYVESDIQQSEILVFPPAMNSLRSKVRRVHIGTHGADVHEALRDLFVAAGWEIIFDFAPNGHFETSLGAFDTNDGVLTARNPGLGKRL